MSNTYTQIHIHTVFAVKNRDSLISIEWRDRLYQYIISIINDQGHKALAVGGTANHVHILLGLRPTQSLSSLIQKVKQGTSEWINKKRFSQFQFQWQNGYGAFSYSKSQLPNVVNYINNQEKHHAKRSFREEYVDILKKFEVDYNEWYLFDEV
jgi:REP element-mobilizing transposase RayT